MNASVAIQVVPKVDGADTLRIVDEVISYIKATGLHYMVCPFETVIEGEFDRLMELVKACTLLCVSAGAPSVLAYVRISYNPAGVLTIDEKTQKHQIPEKESAL